MNSFLPEVYVLYTNKNEIECHFTIFHFIGEIKVIYQDFVGTTIWEHFRRTTCGKLAQCKLCKKTFKCEGGSTKGLHMHIRSIPQIEVSKRKSNNETNMELPKQPMLNAVRTLDYYINDTSLPAVLARMTAFDGLSFNVFTTSPDLRKSLGALGHSLPKSVVVVSDQVVKYGQQLSEEVNNLYRFPNLKVNISA